MHFHRRASAFKGYVQSYTARFDEGSTDPLIVLNEAKPLIFNILRDNSFSLRLRFRICLSVMFVKCKDEIPLFQKFYFCPFAERLTAVFQITGKSN